jgi:hypothetical protein
MGSWNSQKINLMKNRQLSSILLMLMGFPLLAAGQGFSFDGQVSALHLSKISKPWQSVTGIRYIPEIRWAVPAGKTWTFDLEASANAYGAMGATLPDSLDFDGNIRPYRLWGRMATERFEVRLGLQKISFGSATMLRPLMWFDHIDPRDPLQLTDGVYAALGRYFFQNNANVWLWGIWPGKTVKGWEMFRSDPKIPEFGGRFQFPAGKGELALSGHYRQIDKNQSGGFIPVNLVEPVPEYRLGIDGKWDAGPGIWFEGTYTYANLSEPALNHTRMLTLGADYTFGLGNGLTLMSEQFAYQTGAAMFKSTSSMIFSAVSLSYPVNLTHTLSGMVFYNWTGNNWYRFINWRISLKSVSLHVIVFWNPESFDLYRNTGNTSLMGGKGVQLLFVWNH